MKSLVKTQLIVNFFNLNLLQKDKNKLKRWGILLVVIISLLPTYILYIVGLYKLYYETVKIGINLYDIYVSFVYVANQLIVLVLGIFISYYFLYTQNDLELLMSLPYKPYQIMLSKIVVLYINFLLFPTIFFMLPAYVLNLVYNQFGVLKMINSFITIFTMPLLPLIVSVLISYVITFIPAKGFAKTLIQLAIGLVFIGLIFSLQLFLIPAGKNFDVIDFTKSKLVHIVRFKNFIIGSGFGIDTFLYSGFRGVIAQVYNIAFSLACFLVLFFLSSKLYIEPIQKGENSKNKSLIRKKELVLSSSDYTRSSFLKSYLKKELYILIREPVLFINSVGGYITLPFLLVFYKLLGTKDKNFGNLINQIVLFSKHNSAVFSAILGLAIAFFSIGTLFSCTYSKDGKRLWIEKTLPISSKTIFAYKYLFALLFMTIFNIASLVIVGIVFKIGMIQFIFCFVLSEMMLAINGIIGIIIDVKNPKLNWNNMTEAVKQNLNVLYQMGLCSLVIIFNAAIIYWSVKSKVEEGFVYLILILINMLFLGVLIFLAKKASNGLDDINI